MRAKVHVFLKPGVLDVQGKAIEGALHSIGFADVADVRVGKTIEFEVKGADAAKAEADARQMADRLLANAVIESYRVEVG
ncbi:MAG: phosphoribosylformylglycinamidine synthase subunit PurS [Caulobacteraceae bacterium]